MFYSAVKTYMLPSQTFLFLLIFIYLVQIIQLILTQDTDNVCKTKKFIYIFFLKGPFHLLKDWFKIDITNVKKEYSAYT